MNEEQKQNERQEVDFISFEPSATPTNEESDSELEAYYKQLEIRREKEHIESERSRFKGLQTGELAVESISDEYRAKLAAWSEDRYKNAVKEFGDRPWSGTERLDYFLEFYNTHPEVALFFSDQAKRFPEEYKRWCDQENQSSRLARMKWDSERSMAESKKQSDPAYQKQLTDLAKARLIKDGMHNDPDFYLIRDTLFKNKMPSSEMNTLMVTNAETKKQAYRLTNKAVAWGFCDPQSQLAQSARRFVESEAASTLSADETWKTLLANKPSPEDEARCKSLFGPGGAALSMQLLKTNKSEYNRMMDIAGELGIIAKRAPTPVFTSNDDLGSAPRPGSPAAKEYAKKLDAKLARLAELQKGKKNPHMRF